MDSQTFYQKLDLLYDIKPDQVENYLLELSRNESDKIIRILAINELIGYYRVRSNHSQAIEQCFIVIKLIGELGLIEDIQGATTLLNCATAFKAAHCFEEAKLLYERTFNIYKQSLKTNDVRFASLYNNMSDLFACLNNDTQAIHYIKEALTIINKDSHPIEMATSLSNLGGLYLKKEMNIEAEEVLNKAEAIFKQIEDPHYGVCLLYLGKLHQSIEEYEHGLAIIRCYYGKNDDFKEGYQQYVQLLKNKNDTLRYELAKQESIQGLELSLAFYERYGKDTLKTKFPQYYEKMTIGLLGMGSECYGMDDVYSQDHNFYPRFIILIDEIENESFNKIQSAYEHLYPYFLGYQKSTSAYHEKRDGVFITDEFFKSLLGKHYQVNHILDWFYLDEEKLSIIQSGKIFKTGSQLFKQYQENLYYYPEDVRLKKIMTRLAKMAQAGQYNYSRMMKRQDNLTAYQYLSCFINECLHLLFLLNYTYCPYLKWRYKLAMQLNQGKEILELLNELVSIKEMGTMNNNGYYSDANIALIEAVCQLVIKELNKQHLSDSKDSFLQNHLEEIRKRITHPEIRLMHVMEE